MNKSTTDNSSHTLSFEATVAAEEELLASKQGLFHRVDRDSADQVDDKEETNVGVLALHAGAEKPGGNPATKTCPPAPPTATFVYDEQEMNVGALAPHVGVEKPGDKNATKTSPEPTEPFLSPRPLSSPGAFPAGGIELHFEEASLSSGEDPVDLSPDIEDGLAQAQPVTFPTETAEPVDINHPRKTKKALQNLFFLLGFLAVIGFGLSMFFVVGKKDDSTASTATEEPAEGEEEVDAMNWLPDSSRKALEEDRKGTAPVARAFQWITNDPSTLQAHNDQENLQRFVMALFYFATSGDDWTHKGDDVATVTVGVPDDLTVNYKKRGSQRRLLGAFRPHRQLQPPSGPNCAYFTPYPGGIKDFYIHSQPWLSYDHSHCDWFSTSAIVNVSSCNDSRNNQLLTALDLEINNVVGTLPQELALLTSLEILNLFGNQIQGKLLPEVLGKLTNLKYISYYQNKLTGSIPPQVALLTDLWNFDVADNGLTGSLPEELWDMPKLEYLHVGNNALSGSIHPDVGTLLPNLIALRLRMNQMTGTLPTSLGLLSNLFAMGLWDNHFSGTIPAQLGNLSNMKWFLVQHNLLTGTIPSELARATKLRQIKLSGNRGITGTLPTELGLLSNETFTGLDIRDTAITGVIPEALCGIPCLEFDCSPALCGCGCPCSNTTF